MVGDGDKIRNVPSLIENRIQEMKGHLETEAYDKQD